MKKYNYYNDSIEKNIYPNYSKNKVYDTKFVDDLYAQTDRLVSTDPLNARYYFVVGHTINGGRFYSETFTDSLDAINTYHDYYDTVKYFGGGTVELFRITDNDFDIISISRV